MRYGIRLDLDGFRACEGDLAFDGWIEYDSPVGCQGRKARGSADMTLAFAGGRTFSAMMLRFHTFITQRRRLHQRRII